MGGVELYFFLDTFHGYIRSFTVKENHMFSSQQNPFLAYLLIYRIIYKIIFIIYRESRSTQTIPSVVTATIPPNEKVRTYLHCLIYKWDFKLVPFAIKLTLSGYQSVVFNIYLWISSSLFMFLNFFCLMMINSLNNTDRPSIRFLI